MSVQPPDATKVLSWFLRDAQSVIKDGCMQPDKFTDWARGWFRLEFSHGNRSGSGVWVAGTVTRFENGAEDYVCPDCGSYQLTVQALATYSRSTPGAAWVAGSLSMPSDASGLHAACDECEWAGPVSECETMSSGYGKRLPGGRHGNNPEKDRATHVPADLFSDVTNNIAAQLLVWARKLEVDTSKFPHIITEMRNKAKDLLPDAREGCDPLCPECAAPTEATSGDDMIPHILTLALTDGDYWRLCPDCGWDGSPTIDEPADVLRLALSVIQQARDYHADAGEYPPGTVDRDNQEFDDWAADLCSVVLGDKRDPTCSSVVSEPEEDEIARLIRTSEPD